MRKIQILLLPLLLLCIQACNNDRAFENYSYKATLVVEGWIENDNYPKVLLTMSAPLDTELESSDWMNYVIRSARISISDGETTEVLALETNNDYLPPYTYYGSKMKGEPGRTYSLLVEAEGRTLRAETYIPEPIPLENLRFEKTAPEETSGYVHISFRNTAPEGVYYQVATRVEEKEKVFTPCLYGNISRNTFDPNELVDMQINKGPVLYPETSFRTDFSVENEIYLKFKTMPKHGYDFWRSWENEVINTQNPIFPANSSLKSNIEGGGVGIWCGYGVYTYKITP